MTDNAPDLVVRYVLHRRIADYEAVGWIYCASLPMPHGLYSCLMEWPLHKGEPVEPAPEDDGEPR